MEWQVRLRGRGPSAYELDGFERVKQIYIHGILPQLSERYPTSVPFFTDRKPGIVRASGRQITQHSRAGIRKVYHHDMTDNGVQDTSSIYGCGSSPGSNSLADHGGTTVTDGIPYTTHQKFDDDRLCLARNSDGRRGKIVALRVGKSFGH